jgi:hypothetical protein
VPYPFPPLPPPPPHPSPLSGSSALPGQTRAISGGFVGRRWWRGGAGVYSRRSHFSVAFRSSCSFLLCFGALPVVMRCCRLVFLLFVLAMLPRREAAVTVGGGRSSCRIISVLSGARGLRLVLTLPVGRGGEGEGQVEG